MTHEPKVGELPALGDRTWLPWNAEERRLIDSYATECVAVAINAALSALTAEREARKDEARDSERLDWLEKHAKRIGRDGGWLGHYEVIVNAWDGTPYSASRGLALHTDTLRAAIDAVLKGEETS